MRTAVLLSGQIRDAKNCYESLMKHIIEPYDADVFIDTWSPINEIPDGRNQYIPNSFGLDELNHIFKPKLMCVEDFASNPVVQKVRSLYDGLDYPNLRIAYDGSYAWEIRFEAPTFMHYKIWKVNQLRKLYESINDIQYDCVIRTRFDLLFEDFPIIKPEPNTVYIPEGSNHRGGVCDMTVIGDSDSVSKYCSVYSNLENYIKHQMGLHSESLLRRHLELWELKIERFKVKYKLRGEYV